MLVLFSSSTIAFTSPKEVNPISAASPKKGFHAVNVTVVSDSGSLFAGSALSDTAGVGGVEDTGAAGASLGFSEAGVQPAAKDMIKTSVNIKTIVLFIALTFLPFYIIF
jgi:hypothetical protein